MILNPDILVADDDPDIVNETCNAIKTLFPQANIFTAHSGALTLDKLSKQAVDIVILDIRFPDLSGFDILQRLQMPDNVKVIFQTNYSEYALQAFEFYPIHFLTKPVQIEKLSQALNKALQNTSQKIVNFSHKLNTPVTFLSHVLARKNSTAYKIEVGTIVFIVSEDGYCKVHTQDGHSHCCDVSFAWLLNKLNTNSFCKINKSVAINLKYTVKLYGRSTVAPCMEVELAHKGSGTVFKVSRKLEQNVRERVNLYFKSTNGQTLSAASHAAEEGFESKAPSMFQVEQ
jgi:two-component system, LytTR family, response regulator